MCYTWVLKKKCNKLYLQLKSALSKNWRTQVLVAILVGSVRTISIVLGPWLLGPCIEMPSSKFLRSFMHQVGLSISCKVGWQIVCCSVYFAACLHWSRLLFCLINAGRPSFDPTWSCLALILVLGPDWRQTSLSCRVFVLNLVGSASVLIQLCSLWFNLDCRLSIIGSLSPFVIVHFVHDDW